MRIAVVVPVFNGGTQLPQCLTAIAASERQPDQLIVVDDGSTDGSADVARNFGCQTLVSEGGPLGPAAARNIGAAKAVADVLVFVDADVVVHSNAIALMERTLLSAADVAALFGSYDDDPPERGIASLYKNLLHHYVHQHGNREASTFWAGCGAIRSTVFSAIGGFDPRYVEPSIEDIELGARLRNSGYRILLCPEVQATHLKRWTLVSLVRTDVRCRALPWSRLLVAQDNMLDDLNVSVRQRVSALVVIAMLAALAVSFWLPQVLPVAALLAAVFVTLNLHLLRFFKRRGGLLFAIAASGLHLLYFLYSTVAFVWVKTDSALRAIYSRLLLNGERLC